jgi:pilus assembly protein Flp/PilA
MILHRLLRDDSGATAIEYGLIVALIAIAAVTAMSGAGNALSGTMEEARVGMAN